MTQVFVILISFFFSICTFGQDKFNLKITSSIYTDTIIISDLSYLENTMFSIYGDTTVFIDTDSNSLLHLKSKDLNYYLFLTKNSILDVAILDNYEINLIGDNKYFTYFLNEYYQNYRSNFHKSSSFFTNNNIDNFEINLYNFINTEIVNFYQQYEFVDKINIDCKNYFQKLIHYEYLNALSYFILNNNKGFEINEYKKIPLNKDVNIDWLNIEDLEKNLKDLEFYNFKPFQQYIFQTKLLFALDQYKYPLKDVEDFQSFSIYYFNFISEDISSSLFFHCVYNYVYNYGSFLRIKTFDFLIDFLKKKKINSIKLQKIKSLYDNLHQEDFIEVNDYGQNKEIKHDFYIENLDGERVYLSDFEGLVLYVDIWASWCGPCRRQFPYAKELKQKLSRKQLKKIKFIYISIDNDYGKWKNSIDQLGIINQGEHLISPANHSNSAGGYFEASSIPRYILIDRNGEIINNNAKRPSDETLLNDLLELIK